MRDVFAEDLNHGRDFDNPIHSLIAFTGTRDLSYQQLVEILQELKSFPPPPLLRESVQPIYRWSKALPGAEGIRAEDLRGSGVISHIGLSLMGHKDRPITERSSSLSLEEILQEEDQRLRAEWKNSDWIPFLVCSNTNAVAYLRHLATTKDLVWSKDSYKTTYFMLSVGESLGGTLPDLPVNYKGFISITTSKFTLDPGDTGNVDVLKKLRAVLKKMSLTKFSKTFLGEDFINVVDNTAAARPPILKILHSSESKLILEMKLNPAKKTVFFAPIGVAYRA